MNRKQRRRQTEPPHSHRAEVSLRLPANPLVGRENAVAQAFIVSGDNDFELWVKLALDILGRLAPRRDLWAGYLLDFLNRGPEDLRRFLATGLVTGWGLQVIEHPSEKDEKVMECTFPVLYDPLVDPGEVERKKAGIWVPGDPLPGQEAPTR